MTNDRGVSGAPRRHLPRPRSARAQAHDGGRPSAAFRLIIIVIRSAAGGGVGRRRARVCADDGKDTM